MKSTFCILSILAVASCVRLVGQLAQPIAAEPDLTVRAAEEQPRQSTETPQNTAPEQDSAPGPRTPVTAAPDVDRAAPPREPQSERIAPADPAPAGRTAERPPIRHAARLHEQMITPGNFEYVGAFRPPHSETNRESFAYGGWALAFRRDGDADGADDGYPGSLYIVGHVDHQRVAEISIPRPALPKLRTLDDLPVVSVLQPFHDVTDGLLEEMNAGSATPFRIGGLQVAGERLHWTIHKYYNVDGRDFPSHGTAGLQWSTSLADGPWHLGPMNTGSPEWHSYKHAGYIFEIPAAESADWFGGLNLISGLQISTGLQFSSQGPALYAYKLPPEATPPNSSLPAIPLAWYSEQVPLSLHHPADRWSGGAWLTLGGKQAVVVIGRKALGEVYYGEARPQDCTSDKGYHGAPYEVQLIFYSPASLIQVAHGKLQAHALQPWLRWSGEFDGGGISQYMYRTCGQEVGGMAWDRDHHLLYVAQLNAGLTSDNEYEPLPVIHVFRIVD